MQVTSAPKAALGCVPIVSGGSRLRSSRRGSCWFEVLDALAKASNFLIRAGFWKSVEDARYTQTDSIDTHRFVRGEYGVKRQLRLTDCT